jgi:hypothetical protein
MKNRYNKAEIELQGIEKEFENKTTEMDKVR